MSGGGIRHVGAPRTLNVQQFANARGADVQSLHTVLKKKRTQDGIPIPRCLRRRTTSHNRHKSFFWQRKTKKEKRKGEDLDEINAENDDIRMTVKKPLCRRVRRKIELKGDEIGGGGCSRDGTQRLVTHVWHAKRFTMTKIWGHWLAEGLPGRGRGSRAVIAWKNEAAVLHDASFYSAIELEGSWKSISEALQLILEPAPPRSVGLMSQKDQAVYSGVEYGKAMLHHVGRSPRGAIAPVTYIWRRESKGEEARRIWLWVHAGAFEEALSCLQLLCQSQGIHEKDELHCWSRKGQFGRLDLLGSKATSVLQKVLHPVARSASQDGGVDAVLSSFLKNSDQYPAGAVVELEVLDPRFRPGSNTKFEASVLLDGDCDDNEAMDLAGQKLERCPPFYRSDALESSDVWGRSGPARQESIVMPLSEKELSIRRHKKRLSYIQVIDDTPEERTATIGNSKCSIMVLKHERCGFSLILPIGWVRAFWVPLVFAGGHVIGLRERHWLQTDAKLPCFPHDYPDCYSHDQLMVEKSAEYQETYNRKPPSKRGLWKSEVLGWEFVHDISQLDSVNRIVPPEESSRADIEAEIPCGGVAADSGTDPSKTTNADLASPSSAGPGAPSRVSAATVTENSLVDLQKSSTDTLISSPLRDYTAQTNAGGIGDGSSIAPVAVVQEKLRDRDNVGLPGGPSLADPASTSHCVATTDNGQETKIDSSASALEELAEIKEHMVSKVGGSGDSSLFVARTQESLQKSIRYCSLHHLPLLGNFSGKLLAKDRPASEPADDGSTELLKKACLVRVLIHAPRKGVFDEGAVVYLPLPCDVDSYFCSSPRWQGFEDRSFKQVQQSWTTSGQAKLHMPRSECGSLRDPIGIITSASVRGSFSPEAIGICEVEALSFLRHRQVADKRWLSSSTSEKIFLLVRNKCSPMYRPALASIVAETRDDLD